MKRTKYHREHYQKNAEKLAATRQLNRDKFERCISYWRQRHFGRELPGLIAGCSQDLIDKAETHYQHILQQPVQSKGTEL